MRLVSTLVSLALVATFSSALCAQGGGGGNGGNAPPPPPPADASVAFRKDYRLCLARLDGSGQTVIGSMQIDGSIAWAPNGGPLFFQRYSSPWGIYRIQANGTGEALVAPLAGSDKWGVAVTRGAPCPDGSHRVFWCDVTSVGPTWDLFSARLDGSDRRRLTTNQRFNAVSVSPSGDRVVVRDDSIDFKLLTLGLVGGQLAIVGSQSLIDDYPTHPLHWSVDDWWLGNLWFEDLGPNNLLGNNLLFRASNVWVTDERLYRVDVTNPLGLVQLSVPTNATGGVCPTADGQYLFYVKANSYSRASIYRMNANGTGSAVWADAGRKGYFNMVCTRPL